MQLEHEENGATYSVDYMYGIRVKLVFHLVYSPAEPFKYQDQDLYQWRMVCRNHCQVHCQVCSIVTHHTARLHHCSGASCSCLKQS